MFFDILIEEIISEQDPVKLRGDYARSRRSRMRSVRIENFDPGAIRLAEAVPGVNDDPSRACRRVLIRAVKQFLHTLVSPAVVRKYLVPVAPRPGFVENGDRAVSSDTARKLRRVLIKFPGIDGGEGAVFLDDYIIVPGRRKFFGKRFSELVFPVEKPGERVISPGQAFDLDVRAALLAYSREDLRHIVEIRIAVAYEQDPFRHFPYSFPRLLLPIFYKIIIMPASRTCQAVFSTDTLILTFNDFLYIIDYG